jgi:hypothetical protein
MTSTVVAPGDVAPLTITFICTPLSGHANIHLANLTYLLSLPPSASPPLNLHLISEEPTRRRIASLPSSNRHTFTFHAFSDTSFHNERVAHENWPRIPPVRPSLARGKWTYGSVAEVIAMPPQTHLAYHDSIVNILNQLKPDLVLADILLLPALEACITTDVRWGLLSPGSCLDTYRLQQPKAGAFWRVPRCVYQPLLSLSLSHTHILVNGRAFRVLSPSATSR